MAEMTGNIELIQALIKAQEEFPPIKPTHENPFFHSKYASLDEINRAVDPVLRKHGLIVLQLPESSDGEMVLRTLLAHESGQIIESTYLLRPAKDDPQAWGAAMTYARRYSKAAILGIVAEDDDDAERAMDRTGKAGGTKSASRTQRADKKPPPSGSAGMIQSLHGVAQKLGIDHDALSKWCQENCGIASMKEMSENELQEALDKLQIKLDALSDIEIYGNLMGISHDEARAFFEDKWGDKYPRGAFMSASINAFRAQYDEWSAGERQPVLIKDN